MNKTDLIKQLQCLFAWSDFYSQNQLWESYEKCQQQIVDFKKKHNL